MAISCRGPFLEAGRVKDLEYGKESWQNQSKCWLLQHEGCNHGFRGSFAFGGPVATVIYYQHEPEQERRKTCTQTK